MTKLIDLIHKILIKHIDPLTKIPEFILLGYCSNETASEHLSRYLLASKFAQGIVLDVTSGTCYGSSILRRQASVNMVVSVDIAKDALKYGKLVYNTDCVCADATYLPFRKHSFDTVVSLETIAQIQDQSTFLNNIKSCLKKEGKLILSTPNKIIASPFLPNPLNPYNANDFYLGPLLNFLQAHGFRVDYIYGGGREKKLKLLWRIFSSLLKFFLSKFSLNPRLLDNFYYSIHNSILYRRHNNSKHLIDPDPSLIIHEEVESHSNVILYKYFLICAHL
jgi:ubiquinone/menaquinone biosynthesis C-methylase UbiE